MGKVHLFCMFTVNIHLHISPDHNIMGHGKFQSIHHNHTSSPFLDLERCGAQSMTITKHIAPGELASLDVCTIKTGCGSEVWGYRAL